MFVTKWYKTFILFPRRVEGQIVFLKTVWKRDVELIHESWSEYRLHLDINETASELMRLVDAYAHDYQKKGKLCPSRFELEELVRMIVTTKDLI